MLQTPLHENQVSTKSGILPSVLDVQKNEIRSIVVFSIHGVTLDRNHDYVPPRFDEFFYLQINHYLQRNHHYVAHFCMVR